MTTMLNCAIYTRVSTESGLDQEFNSIDNQREAAEAYVRSQRQEGWRRLRTRYDDGGYSGGSIDRPALRQLVDDVEGGRVDVIVVYKVDRLTRSLSDFVRLVELFDRHGVSFVSVTQAFSTTSSLGRLTLNILLSFARFERELTGERIRDKIAASKQKGIWMGGTVPLGYRVESRALHIVEEHAAVIRELYAGYLALGSMGRLKAYLDRHSIQVPRRIAGSGAPLGGGAFSVGQIAQILHSPIYAGRLPHKGQVHEGQHPAVVDQDVWDAVQKRLAAGRGRPRKTAEPHHDALLPGSRIAAMH